MKEEKKVTKPKKATPKTKTVKKTPTKKAPVKKVVEQNIEIIEPVVKTEIIIEETQPKKLPKKMPKWGIALIIIAGLLLYVIPMAVTIWEVIDELSEKPITESDLKYMWDNENLTIEKSSLIGYYDEEQKSYIIEGLLKNNNEDKNYPEVDITFKLYDANGNLLAVEKASIYNLSAGETWKVSIAHESKFADEINSFKIENLYFYYY